MKGAARESTAELAAPTHSALSPQLLPTNALGHVFRTATASHPPRLHSPPLHSRKAGNEVPNFCRSHVQGPQHRNCNENHTIPSTAASMNTDVSTNKAFAEDTVARSLAGITASLSAESSSHTSSPTWSRPPNIGTAGFNVAPMQAPARLSANLSSGCQLPPIGDLLRILSHDQSMARQTQSNTNAVQPLFPQPYPQSHCGRVGQLPSQNTQHLQHPTAQPYSYPLFHPPTNSRQHVQPHQRASTRPTRALARANRGASNGSSPTSLSASDSVDDDAESALSAPVRTTDDSVGDVAPNMGIAAKLHAQSPPEQPFLPRHNPHQQRMQSSAGESNPYHRVPPRLSLKPSQFVPATHMTNQFQTSTPYSAAPPVHIKQEGFNQTVVASTPMPASSYSNSVYPRNNYPPFYSNHQPSTPPNNTQPPQQSRTYSPNQSKSLFPPYSLHRFPSEQHPAQHQLHDGRQQAVSFPPPHTHHSATGSVNIPITSASSSNREKPHACSDCPKAFARSNDLKRHQLTHTPEEKPYACQWCGKKFSRPDSVRKHEASVVEKRRVRCSGNPGSE